MNTEYAILTRRTNYPKLGYIIFRLKEEGITCRLRENDSFYAPILEVDSSKFGDAWQLLEEKHGRYALDDMRDNHPKFRQFEDEKP